MIMEHNDDDGYVTAVLGNGNVKQLKVSLSLGQSLESLESYSLLGVCYSNGGNRVLEEVLFNFSVLKLSPEPA
jgi:hypothetical protein